MSAVPRACYCSSRKELCPGPLADHRVLLRRGGRNQNVIAGIEDEFDVRVASEALEPSAAIEIIQRLPLPANDPIVSYSFDGSQYGFWVACKHDGVSESWLGWWTDTETHFTLRCNPFELEDAFYASGSYPKGPPGKVKPHPQSITAVSTGRHDSCLCKERKLKECPGRTNVRGHRVWYTSVRRRAEVTRNAWETFRNQWPSPRYAGGKGGDANDSIYKIIDRLAPAANKDPPYTFDKSALSVFSPGVWESRAPDGRSSLSWFAAGKFHRLECGSGVLEEAYRQCGLTEQDTVYRYDVAIAAVSQALSQTAIMRPVDPISRPVSAFPIPSAERRVILPSMQPTLPSNPFSLGGAQLDYRGEQAGVRPTSALGGTIGNDVPRLTRTARFGESEERWWQRHKPPEWYRKAYEGDVKTDMKSVGLFFDTAFMTAQGWPLDQGIPDIAVSRPWGSASNRYRWKIGGYQYETSFIPPRDRSAAVQLGETGLGSRALASPARLPPLLSPTGDLSEMGDVSFGEVAAAAGVTGQNLSDFGGRGLATEAPMSAYGGQSSTLERYRRSGTAAPVRSSPWAPPPRSYTPTPSNTQPERMARPHGRGRKSRPEARQPLPPLRKVLPRLLEERDSDGEDDQGGGATLQSGTGGVGADFPGEPSEPPPASSQQAYSGPRYDFEMTAYQPPRTAPSAGSSTPQYALTEHGEIWTPKVSRATGKFRNSAAWERHADANWVVRTRTEGDKEVFRFFSIQMPDEVTQYACHWGKNRSGIRFRWWSQENKSEWTADIPYNRFGEARLKEYLAWSYPP